MASAHKTSSHSETSLNKAEGDTFLYSLATRKQGYCNHVIVWGTDLEDGSSEEVRMCWVRRLTNEETLWSAESILGPFPFEGKALTCLVVPGWCSGSELKSLNFGKNQLGLKFWLPFTSWVTDAGQGGSIGPFYSVLMNTELLSCMSMLLWYYQEQRRPLGGGCPGEFCCDVCSSGRGWDKWILKKQSSPEELNSSDLWHSDALG